MIQRRWKIAFRFHPIEVLDSPMNSESQGLLEFLNEGPTLGGLILVDADVGCMDQLSHGFYPHR